MVEVVFKGWMFNRPNMVWADVKKDTYIKSQSIDTLLSDRLDLRLP